MGGLVKVGPARKAKKNRRYSLENGHCEYCGCQFETKTERSRHHETKDHKTPKARGGSNHPSNIARCCWQCNNDKGVMNEAEFRRYLLTGVKAPDRMVYGTNREFA